MSKCNKSLRGPYVRHEITFPESRRDTASHHTNPRRPEGGGVGRWGAELHRRFLISLSANLTGTTLPKNINYSKMTKCKCENVYQKI